MLTEQQREIIRTSINVRMAVQTFWLLNPDAAARDKHDPKSFRRTLDMLGFPHVDMEVAR